MFRSSSLFNHRFNSFKRRRVKNSQRSFLQIAAVGASVLFILFVLGSFALLGVFLYYSKDLPQPGKLVNRERSLSTRIYDRNGKLLYDVHEDQNRTLVRLGDLPEDLVHATLAAEDADFYSHQGFDLIGIARAVYNIAVHRELQGGSTITQQLVRNTLISSERTLTRKIKEFVLALQIERKYSKDEILEMYLNEAPYGGQLYGVEAAAQAYFRKSAKDVNLAQSAFLAGLSQAPSRYSPYGSDPERAENRRKYVLYLMATRGWVGVDGQRHYLEEDRAEQAKDVELTYAPPGGEFKAPHFVMYVKELLGNRFGEDLIARSGLQVRTTLDLEMQQRLQQIVREEVMNAQKYKIGNGALVVIDPRTGELLAMVGSRDFFDENYDGQVNVTLRPRQPGSSIKPITYATAFEQGYTPATVLFDVPTCFPGGAGQQEYCPGNYDGKYRGPLPLRSTLANSINVVAVKLLKLVGVDSMLDTAKKMGISTFDDPSRYGLALTLGGGEVTLLELTNAYSVFAAEGNYRDPQAILKVTDSHDRVLEKFSPSEGRRVLSEETAFLISDILSDNAARTPIFGPWSYLHIPGYSVAVKTGTTNDMRDNWTIGYTKSLAVGVWVGNNDYSPMGYISSGSVGASQIWNRAMKALLEEKENEPFEKPEGVVEETVCRLSGKTPNSWCNHEDYVDECDTYNEYFIDGTVPIERCEFHQLLEICEPDGKLASEACEAAGETEKKVFIDFQAQLPEWQESVDTWVEEQYGDDDKYHPPEEESERYFHPDDKEEPWVKIIDPEADKLPLEFNSKVEVITPYSVNKVVFYLDGEQVGDSVTSSPYEKDFELTEDDIGEHELKIKAYDSGGNVGETKKTITIEEKD